MSQTKLISLDNLTRYDGKIKELIHSETGNTTYTLSVGTGADASKIVLTDSDGNEDKVTVPYATNAGTVNGKTVAENVPSGAVFTDTKDADDLNYDNTDSGLSATKVQGAIDEVNDKTDDLADIVSGEAKTVDYASVITVDDAMPVNADVTAKIEPIQDLHGYDKPWVGGAGKNQLPLVLTTIKSSNTEGTWSGNTYTYKNVSFTVNTDDDGNVTGINVDTSGASDQVEFKLNTGTYKSNTFGGMLINGCSDGSSSTYAVFIAYSNNGTSWASEAWQYSSDVTISSSYSYIRVSILVKSGASVSNKVVYPMLRLSTVTDATFEPYTNICPISGWDACKVVTNLFDPTQTNAKNNIAIESDGTETSSVYWSLSEEVAVNGNTKYSVRYSTTNSGSYFTVAYYDQNHIFISTYAPTVESGRGYKIAQFVTPSNAKYIKLNIPKEGQNYTQDWYSVTMGENNNYGNIYTISLNGTRYGGTLHVDTNGNTELYINKGYIEFDGSNDENWHVSTSSSYIGNAYIYIGDAFDDQIPICNLAKGVPYDDNYKHGECIISGKTFNIWLFTTSITVSNIKSYLSSNPAQVAYRLLHPFSITLSNNQIQLLKDTNILFSNTGDVKINYETGIEDSIANVQEQVNDVQSGFMDAIGWDNHKNLLELSLSDIKSIDSDWTWSQNNATKNGITVSVLTDDYDRITGFIINGTATGNTYFVLRNKVFTDTNATIFNGCPSGGGSNKYGITFWTSSQLMYIDYGEGISVPPNAIGNEIYIYIANGYTASNLGIYPMIRKASDTDPTFQPYHPVLGSAVEDLLAKTKYSEDINAPVKIGTLDNGKGVYRLVFYVANYPDGREGGESILISTMLQNATALSVTGTANGHPLPYQDLSVQYNDDGDIEVIADSRNYKTYSGYITLEYVQN